MNRRNVISALKPLFGLSLLGLVASQVDLAQFRALLSAGQPGWLALSGLSFFCSLTVFQAARLHVLVRRYTGGAAVSWRLFFVGAFFNNLLPSNVGGDAVRLVYLRRMGDGGWAGPLALLLLHRLSGLMTIVVGFAMYAVCRGERLLAIFDQGRLGVATGGSWSGLAALVGLMTGLALWLFSRTRPGHRLLFLVRSRLSQTWSTARAALSELGGPTLAVLVTLTVLFHGARMLGFYAAVHYFGATIDLWDIVPVLMLTALMALIPVTVGGLGVVEGSVSMSLGLFSVAPAAAVATALLNRVVLIVVALLGGLVYAFDRPPQKSPGDSVPRFR